MTTLILPFQPNIIYIYIYILYINIWQRTKNTLHGLPYKSPMLAVWAPGILQDLNTPPDHTFGSNPTATTPITNDGTRNAKLRICTKEIKGHQKKSKEINRNERKPKEIRETRRR